MKIFLSIQRYFSHLGVRNDQLKKTHPFNSRNVIVAFSFILCLISNSVYLLYGASTFDEYIESVYLTSTALVDGITFAIDVWKM